MRNFEGSFEQVERSMELEKMHERAKKTLLEEAVRPEDFGQYDPAKVVETEAFVRMMRERFEKNATPEEREAKQLADVLEAVVLNFGERGYWFGGGSGESVTMMKTAEYDDIANGADMIVESYSEGGGVSNLGLAIDVTYRRDISSKMSRIMEEVRSGDPATIRYFYSPRRDFRGEQRSVPRVIAGISGDHVRDLGRLWMAKKNKQLSEHPVQIVLLEEMEAQLEEFRSIAELGGRKRAATSLADSLAMVKKALGQKEEFISRNRDAIDDFKMKDQVYSALMDRVR